VLDVVIAADANGEVENAVEVGSRLESTVGEVVGANDWIVANITRFGAVKSKALSLHGCSHIGGRSCTSVYRSAQAHDSGPEQRKTGQVRTSASMNELRVHGRFPGKDAYL